MDIEKKIYGNLDIEDKFYDSLEHHSESIKMMVNIILSRLNKSNDKNIDFIDDFSYFLKEEDEKGRDKKRLLSIFRRLFKKVSVPGIINKNGKLITKTNIDSKASIFLLKLAGFNIEQLFYQKNRKKTRYGFINLDLGINNGLSIEGYEQDGLRSFFSKANISFNHDDRKISSTTQMIYRLLMELGALEHIDNKQLNRFISFIDLKENSFNIYSINSEGRKPYLDSYRTLFGLADYLPIKNIFRYFKENRNGFELLDIDFLKNNFYRTSSKVLKSFFDISEKRRLLINSSIIGYSDMLKNKNILKYYNQDLTFLVDIGGNMVNSLEISAFNSTGLIKVNKNLDIMIYNPKGFPNKFEEKGLKKGVQIDFIKKHTKDYYEKIEGVLELLSGDKKLKLALLKYINYEGKFLDILKPKISKEIIKKQKEIKKALIHKQKNRNKRKNRHIKRFEDQSINPDDLYEKMIINGKIIDISSKSRLYVDIKLQSEFVGEWEVYVTPTRLKEKSYSMNKIIGNKLAKTKEEKEDIIYTFKILSIKKDLKRIALKQI